ncbi:F-box/LRR-repeat protein 12-like [Papaver somniferum]|uniref:F-box/LRR-repeat protein 12-like n=1 Tax=Papaver somniferum TaxID=3469 RepID=UPI000E6F89C5|nr:F-box/LRR-repeat protein 12-like [Papaver somniferum]
MKEAYLLSSSNTDSKGLGKRMLQLTSKEVQEEISMDDAHPYKRDCQTLSITDLPDECLNRVYESLKSSTDRSSFGLVLFLCLNPHFKYLDMMQSLIISPPFPRLTSVRLVDTNITDKGIDSLTKCCPSLEKVDLTKSNHITDSGISFLLQNCHKLGSLSITDCERVTGTGFLGCPKTLTEVSAYGKQELTTEGIKAIVSGGGLQSLYLSGNTVNDEAVIAISKGCPLLKVLRLKSCNEVQLEGWKAIGLHCRHLKALYLVECLKLCHVGLQALCNGCNQLSYFFTDTCRVFAIDLFTRERRNVRLL